MRIGAQHNPNYPISTALTISMTAAILPITHCEYDMTGQTYTDDMHSPSTACATAWAFADDGERVVSTSLVNTVAEDEKSGVHTEVKNYTNLTATTDFEGQCLGCCDKEVCTDTRTGGTVMLSRTPHAIARHRPLAPCFVPVLTASHKYS